MIMPNTWLYLFAPGDDEHVEMRRVRDGRVAPSRTEGWWLTCRSATERQGRVFSVLFACPAVNIGTM
jgi:hypothetical protein